MKAQEMPTRTITIIIIAIVAMAVIIIWYLMYSGKISSSTWDFLKLGKSQSSEACSMLLPFGGCPEGQICCDGECKIPEPDGSCPPT